MILFCLFSNILADLLACLINFSDLSGNQFEFNDGQFPDVLESLEELYLNDIPNLNGIQEDSLHKFKNLKILCVGCFVANHYLILCLRQRDL